VSPIIAHASGRGDNNLLEGLHIRAQFLIARWNTVELENIRYDVKINLVVQTARLALRHGAANVFELPRNYLSDQARLNAPSVNSGASGSVE